MLRFQKQDKNLKTTCVRKKSKMIKYLKVSLVIEKLNGALKANVC